MSREIPALTTDQMVEVDRLMVEEFQIDLIQMMENAGRNLAVLARDRFLSGDPRGKRVLVLAGSGGNGGGGLVAARRLHSWGARVVVYLARHPDELTGVPAHQLRILRGLGDVDIITPAEERGFPDADLLLDALIGYSLQGPPRGAAGALIQRAEKQTAPILSLDVPSGMDAGTGERYPPHITADATLTLALPKRGLIREGVKPAVGELYLADIGVPPEVYDRLGLTVGPIFASGEIRPLF